MRSMAKYFCQLNELFRFYTLSNCIIIKITGTANKHFKRRTVSCLRAEKCIYLFDNRDLRFSKSVERTVIFEMGYYLLFLSTFLYFEWTSNNNSLKLYVDDVCFGLQQRMHSKLLSLF